MYTTSNDITGISVIVYISVNNLYIFITLSVHWTSRGNCSLEQWACRKVGACQKVGGVPKGFSLVKRKLGGVPKGFVKRKLGGVPKGFAKAGCSA